MTERARWRDYVALTKPGVTRMCMITTAGAVVLAPGPLDLVVALSAIVGSGMAVGSANALNMWWERGPDHLMVRTRNRPVAAGRIAPGRAALFAAGLGSLALAILLIGANALAASLAALAFVIYVLVYTPLKYRTPLALLIGAVPGAIPPLLGWTAVTGSIDAAGLALFAILLVWQIPHFLAISLYRKHEYERAGIKVVPLVRGDWVAKLQAAAWSLLLVPVTVSLTPLGVTGDLYLGAGLFLSVGFFVWSLTGLRADAGSRWARGLFLASLFYLPALTLALVLDVVLR